MYIQINLRIKTLKEGVFFLKKTVFSQYLVNHD